MCTAPCPAYLNPKDPLKSFNSSAAWRSLSPFARDVIGALAVEMVFAGFVQQDLGEDPLWFDEATRAEAGRKEDALLGALIDTIDKALPELFGTDANPPTWPEAFGIGETDEQFLDRLVVKPLLAATAPAVDHDALAHEAGWTRQTDDTWLRLAGDREPANETFGNGRRAITVNTAEEACEWDGLDDHEIAEAAVRGARHAFATATMLVGA